MDALTPPPITEPPDDQPPVATAPTQSGPLCKACGIAAVVHWLRRPTDSEVTEAAAVEKERRAQVLLLTDPQLPRPEFGPLPTAADMTRTVYACASHAITLEAAALLHQSRCTAPNEADLPACDCTPEAPPQTPPTEPPPARALPAHWVTGDA
ncbi:hypothetical protein ACH4UM_19010 [Streptomyces sp. NPDC020801]|uniref:hypothetical protein n=1 Tax=Streptomyces sp. NPDC020801 TaxID=3365093 RepID=UPI003792F4C1